MKGHAREHVILLHGLCRTRTSMQAMERALAREGYPVSNVGYPSRTARIEELSERVIGAAVAECRQRGATCLHFVAHSLGGILVRSYFTRHPATDVGRMVMLGPPNRGSELVDRLGAFSLFTLLNGPAGRQLGTGPDSVPLRLGPPAFCIGVIAGNRSINWINSLIIPGPDDGKVSVERTRLDGMADHLVLPTTHPFMMRNREVIRQTMGFLRTGAFER